MVMLHRSMVTSVSFLVFTVLLAGMGNARAQPGPALAGKVSAALDVLEGVLVSAKKDGSTVTVTVVSDRDGRYSFPAARLEPGQYSLRIRAVGYDLGNSGPVSVVADRTATADLALRKTEDLAAQLSNAEWLASMPGTDAQKGQLLNCVGCHTLERPLRSNYGADDFMNNILPRMQGYVNQSIPAHPQLRRAERLMEERGDQRVQVYRAAAEFLASINLSSHSQWNFELKTLPRPTGAGTRVIYTEYDLPRETISPHDVIVDRDGTVRQSWNGCADRWIHFLITAIISRLIVDAIGIIEGQSANCQCDEPERQYSEVAVEMEIVPVVVAVDINVHVAMDKDIATSIELAAGFDAPLRFRTHLKGTLDGVSIKMADSTVGWTFHNGRACRPQGRPGRGYRRARSEAAAARGTATRSAAVRTSAGSAERGKSEE